MQNNVHSNLLDNYIAFNKSRPETQCAQSYAISPVYQNQTDEYKGSKKAKTAKIALGAAIILTAATTVFAALRHKTGLNKALKKGFDKFSRFFTSQSEKAENTAKTITEKVSGLSEYQNGANNVTNAKDSLLKHYLSKIPGYKKVDGICANLYKKACKSSVENGYKKAFSSVENAKAGIDKALRNGTSDKESASRIKELISKNVNAAVCDSGVSTRFNKIDKSMRSLEKDVIKSIGKSTKDTESIKKGVQTYTRKSLAQGRLQKSKKIQNELMEQVKSKGLNSDEAKELKELLSNIKDKNLLKKINKADNAFEKALAKENTAMFDKLRDINCGSAASDILGAAGTAGLLGIYTAQADSKEEKIGVTLTTGLPLAVTIATTLGATIKMISGAKAMLLGMGTGFIANRLGKFANKKYQERKGIETPEKTIATIDDYSNAVRSKLNLQS